MQIVDKDLDRSKEQQCSRAEAVMPIVEFLEVKKQ